MSSRGPARRRTHRSWSPGRWPSGDRAATAAHATGVALADAAFGGTRRL